MDSRARDRAVPQVLLNSPRVVSLGGKGLAASVAKLVRVGFQPEAEATTDRTLDHPGKPAVVNGAPRKLTKTKGDGLLSRCKRWASSTGGREPKYARNAQKNYETYLALARAEALIGNTVGAENYYQHAEHYFRSMNSDQRVGR